MTLGLVLLAVALAWRASTFYRLDVATRVEHPDYRTLSPSGFVGHGYGIAGTALMLTNLLYLVRRRFPSLPVGSMRLWLHIHVFTGLAGAQLVLFHSAFQLRTPLASGTGLAVALVVLTGVIGRYLVTLTPKADAELIKDALATLERIVPGLRRALREALEAHEISEPSQSLFLPVAIARVPGWLREGRERKQLVLGIVAERAGGASVAEADRETFDRTTAALADEAAREAHAVAARTVLSSWRGLHRFFAFLLVVSVVVHVGVAWHYGYRWIWSD